jgi:hypothetical protein
MADNILTKDRDAADIDLAAKDIASVKYPRNILTDPSGNDLTPLTDAQLRASPLYLGIADGANLDAFSRMRVSDPVALFAVQCQYNAAQFQMEAGATGTGVAPAHDANTRMVALSCTAGSGTSFVQSFEYIPYQPGKSQLGFFTGVLGAGVAGAVVDVGLFDALNGFFFRQNGASGLQLIRRSSTTGSVVDEVVPQASWNIDKLDGTGRSGLTLDPTKAFILALDAQFLGMGRCRVYFDIGGQLVQVHEFRHANVLAVPYMQSLTLPVQMLITATSTGSTKTAHFKCASVSSEGGFSEDAGFSFSTANVAVTAANGARTAIVSFRPLTTFNSLPNRQKVRVDSVDILAGTNPIRWELVLGATFSVAPTYAAVDATRSGCEASTAPGTLATAPHVIASGFISGSATVRGTISAASRVRYPISLDRAGAVRAAGTVTLVATGLGGTSALNAAINYTEIR